MYAFGPLPKYKKSGRIIGTHQKIDRVARRHIAAHIEPELSFPEIDDILHFEGSRGPDGVKLKSPGKDEPSHFIDPKNLHDDDELLMAIREHSRNLTNALIAQDMVRAAFEAAWMAHAVADGLTPAHHDPFDEQMKELKHTDGRKHKVSSKIVMSGSGSRKKFIKNNWKYWGAGGIMTTHTLFEAGIATAAKPLMFKDAQLTTREIEQMAERGFISLYKDFIHEIDSLDMYGRYKQSGWTRSLARETTKELMPTIVKAVTLAWLASYHDARRKS